MRDTVIYARQYAHVRVELCRICMADGTLCDCDTILRLKLWVACREAPSGLRQILVLMLETEEAWRVARTIAIAGLLLERELDYCFRQAYGKPTRGHLPHGVSYAMLQETR